MRIRRAGALIILLVLSVSVVHPGLALGAQEDEATPVATPSPLQFGIYPVGDFQNGYFEVEIEAGSSMSLTAGVINAATESITLRTFAANAFNPPNGGFGAATEEDVPSGPTLWLDYPADSFELEPGEQRPTNFTVAVPADTAPGQYVTALVVRTEGALTIPGSEMFQQIIRNAMSVEITVPGAVTPGFTLGRPAFSTDTAVRSLIIPVVNTGNILVKPTGELVVTTPAGKATLTSAVAMGSVYGGSSTTIQISLPEQFPAGDYLISAILTDPDTKASAIIDKVPVALTPLGIATSPTFVVDLVSIAANADPVQFANVSATITNNGPAIPTATVMLTVQRNGEQVESYPLAQNQALPQGSTEFTQRYVPIDGWQEGTYTFQLVIVAVSDGTETVLSTIDVAGEIVVP